MNNRDDYDYDEPGSGAAVGWAALLIALAVAFALLFIGCTTTRYVPVESVRTEYRDNAHEVRTTDSVTDTRFVYVNGDTVVDWRERVKWREKVVRDSIYIELVDTIREPYPVEKTLTRWQQAKVDWGGWAFAICAVLAAVACAGFGRKFT